MAQSWQQSPDIQVEWAGWRSSTRALQACGWEFVINQMMDRWHDRFELLLRHRYCKMAARMRIPESMAFDRAADWQGALTRESHWRPVQIEQIVTEEQFKLFQSDLAPARWGRVDMEPLVVDMATVPLSRTSIFRPWAPEAQEIIADPATVMSLLEQAKRLLNPELAEIRKRRRINGEPTQELVSAQIITLAA